MLHPSLATTEALDSIGVERQIVAALDHPGIARLLDGGTTDEGLPYLVLEYVEGEAIDRYAKQHRLSVEARLRLVQQVCEAVEYAHARGVIHRDLKPNNILVQADGAVKLVDFGIAAATGRQQATALMRMLTPEYASPEQIRQEPVKPASDIYSLGVVLYELLAGKSPYALPNRQYATVVRSVCEDIPERPSATVGDKDGQRRFTPDLDAVVLTALEKDWHHRYTSIAALRADLDLYLADQPVSVSSRRWLGKVVSFLTRYSLRLAALAGVAGLFASGLLKADPMLWIMVLAGGSMAFGAWLRSQKVSSRFQERVVWPQTLVRILVNGLLLFLMFRSKDLLDRWNIPFPRVMIGICAGTAVFMFLRNRWNQARGGQLFETVAMPGVKYLTHVFLALTLASLVPLTWLLMHGEKVTVVTNLTLLLSSAVSTWVCRRVEFREGGVLVAGTLTAWSKFSYQWDTEKPLQLNLTAGKGLFHRAALLCEQDQKDRLHKLFDQHSGEWPAR